MTSCCAKTDRKIDFQYIRTCAVFKLLKTGKITSRKRALKLLHEKHLKRSKIDLTLDIWLKGPLKHLNIK